MPLKVLERKSEIEFNFSKGTVFCTRNRHKQKDIMKTMNTFLKYPENTAFIICRIVFGISPWTKTRNVTYGLQNLGLAGAEEE